MQIFEMMGSILIDDKQGTSALDKFDKKGQSVSKSIGSAFGAIGKASLVVGGAIMAGLGWAMAEGVKGVVAMEDQTAQLNAVLKSTEGAVGLTSKEISGMATALQLTTKFAEEDTLAGQNMLLTFTNIGKDVFPQATTTLLDLATVMGTDAKSGAIQLGKALNDPEKGITALTRVGVTFTDEQKKSIKAMQESGDMAGAQTVILKELEKEFGGSAKAAGETFSGKLVILKNKLGELTEGFATGFMPYLQKFMDWVSSNMPTIQSVMQKAFDIIGKTLKVAGDFVTSTVIPALQKLYDWIKPHIPEIKQFISDAFTKIKEVLKVAGDFITDKVIPALQRLWDWIEPNIPAIKDTIKTAFDTSTEAIKKTIKVIEDIIDWFVKYKAIITPIVAVVSLVIINAWAVTTAKAVASAITHDIQSAKVVANWLWMGLKSTAHAIKVVASWVATAASAVASAIVHAAQAAVVVAKWLWMGVQSAIHALKVVASWVLTSAGAIAAGLVMIAQSAVVVAKWVWMGVQSLLQAAKMAAAWVIAMGPIAWVAIAVAGIAVLIIANWDKVKAKTIEIFTSVSTWLSTKWTEIKTFAVQTFENMKTAISGKVSSIKDAIVNGFNSAISFITGLPGKAYGWGKDFINGLKNGIMSAINGIANAVSGIASKIRGFLHFSTPDEGPLADYESWMPDFMGGLAKGIENSKYLVANAVKGLSSDVNVGMNLTPAMAGVGSTSSTQNQSPTKQGDNIINFNGNYSFAGQSDIDYLMNKAGLLVQRRMG